MEETPDMARIEPTQLTEDSPFEFECKTDLSCFTRCCRGIDIVLTPYDIIRLKNRLDLSSTEFLALYTTPELLLKTDLPVPLLKLLDDEDKSCPFVRDDGCIVYEDRPTACRYYPLGHAILRPKEAPDSEKFYFFVKEPHCKGFDCPTEWTVKEWRKDQGVDEYDDENSAWMNVVVRKRSFPPNLHITAKAKEMFFLASYDMDRFRRFVFDSSFLKLNPLDEKTIERIRTNDVALMQMGARWLEGVLFSQGEMKVSEERAKQRMEQKGEGEE